MDARGELKRRAAIGLAWITLAATACGGKEAQPAQQTETLKAQAPVEAELTEFEGAYPEHALPNGQVHEISLRAAESQVQLFEGRVIDAWAYNAQVPGPTIRMTLGETLLVHLDNALPQPTTIHWHGVRVPNAMDGVPGVTQPPVAPGESFDYEFTPKDAGTFWFHPHVRGAEQVERGLYGVLIVEDAEPAPYNQDLVWVLDDWRLTPDGSAIDPRFVTRGDLAHDGRWGNVVAVNGILDTREVVRPGERVRLRLINPANGRVFRPDFGELEPTVIAVDGMYVAKPFAYRGFDIAPGNRLDLDITIPPELAGKSIRVSDRMTRRVLPLASIDVRGDAVPTPVFDWPAHAKIPTWAGGMAAQPDLSFALNAVRGGQYGIEWQINGKAYDPQHAEPLTQGRWHKLRFENLSGRLHPMHIHGQFFKVLSRNGQPAGEEFWRDTVLLKPREVVDVGLVPLDEGKWMLHCHILEHAESGMMTMVHVRPEAE